MLNNELQTIRDTVAHINKVKSFIDIVIKELLEREEKHDKSKLEDFEFPHFVKADTLKHLTYGSDEYKQALEDLKPALIHHYANNSHHPEHYENGIDGMDLIDIVEMFCDWYAATKRHNDGDINRSIVLNKDRFKMSEQLVNIFKNSVKYFEDK